MAWLVLVLVTVAVVVTLSSVWWAHHPVVSGVVLAVLCVVSMAALGTKQANWGGDVEQGADGWCMTYDHPDGTRLVQCWTTEHEAWAWADALDAELEDQYGPRETSPAWADWFGVPFFASLGGVIVAFGWAIAQRRRDGRRQRDADVTGADSELSHQGGAVHPRWR